MVVLSEKTSRFHPRHVVLKPTQADAFEIVERWRWALLQVLTAARGRFCCRDRRVDGRSEPRRSLGGRSRSRGVARPRGQLYTQGLRDARQGCRWWANGQLGEPAQVQCNGSESELV